MEQETVANPEPAAEEVTQTQEAEQGTETDESIEQEQPEGQASEEDDSEDTEWEGKSFKAPKGLKDFLKEGVLRQSDYTKKTMELADRQKAWTSSIEANRAFTADVGKLMVMDDQLQEFGKVDWQTLSAQDPARAQSLWFQYQQVRDNRANMAGDLERRSREQEAKAEQDYATRISHDLATLSKPDPTTGWTGKFTPELKAKLETFGRSIGYTDEHLSRASANDVKTLNLAMLGQEYLKQQRALAKQQKPEAQPVPKIEKGRGNVIQGLSDRLSVEEWNRRRQAQVDKAGGR